jgi:hypothetical protein
MPGSARCWRAWQTNPRSRHDARGSPRSSTNGPGGALRPPQRSPSVAGASPLGGGRLRRPGGGRKKAVETDTTLPGESGTIDRPGDPRRSGVAPEGDVQEHPQAGRGTEAEGARHQPRLVAELLHGRGDSLQANDGGGSNGSRGRLWKRELQRLASATGLRIAVGPFPPGTSKGTKIAPWLVSLLSPNWRGRPLVSHEGVVHLIAATTTERGLKVAWELDRTRLLQGSRSRRRPGRGSD